LSIPLIPTQKETLWQAEMAIVKLAGPSILSFILQFLVEIINMFFIGNIDIERLDGIGLGNMWGNFIGVAVGWGLAGGLDTLCSQANGNKQYEMVGVWLQRGVVVLTVAFIPITVAILYTAEVLMLMGVEEKIAEYSYNYLSCVLPGLWFFLCFDFFRRYLQAQEYFWPGLVVNGITTSLHIFWCWLFIIEFDWLEKGAGIATSVTYFLNFVVMVSLIKYCKLDQKTCKSCNFQNFFHDIKKFLRYALPSAGMLLLDQLNFEITQVEASHLGVKTQAAHVAVANTVTTLYMIPLGLGISITSIVGNFVGEGNSAKAKLYSWAALMLFFLTNFPLEILVLTFREPLSQLYTYDTEVSEIIAKLFIPVMLFNAIDFFQVVLCGVLKGIARQSIAFIMILISYYVFAIPGGYLMAFHLDFDIYGIWYGLVIGATMATATLSYLAWKSRWAAVTLEKSMD